MLQCTGVNFSDRKRRDILLWRSSNSHLTMLSSFRTAVDKGQVGGDGEGAKGPGEGGAAEVAVLVAPEGK